MGYSKIMDVFLLKPLLLDDCGDPDFKNPPTAWDVIDVAVQLAFLLLLNPPLVRNNPSFIWIPITMIIHLQCHLLHICTHTHIYIIYIH